MRSVESQRGFGVIDAFVGAAVLSAAWAAYVTFVGKSQEREYRAQGGFSQTVLMSNILYKITSRRVINAAAPNSIAACIRGNSVCKNGTADYQVTMDGVPITGTEQVPALYTNDGRPCNRFGLPDGNCPIGASAKIQVKCGGSGNTCQRPLYIYADVILSYPPKGAGSTTEVPKLSSASFVNSIVTFNNFIYADCSSQNTESKPDKYDPVQEQRSSLSQHDRSYFFGFDEAFKADMPDAQDRDYQNYCRKLRIVPSNCPTSDGGGALHIRSDGTLECMTRTGLTSVAVANPAPAGCAIPAPGPTTSPLTPTPSPTPCPAHSDPIVNGDGSGNGTPDQCSQPCQDTLHEAAAMVGYTIPTPDKDWIISADGKPDKVDDQRKWWKVQYDAIKTYDPTCDPLRNSAWK